MYYEVNICVLVNTDTPENAAAEVREWAETNCEHYPDANTRHNIESWTLLAPRHTNQREIPGVDYGTEDHPL